MIAFPLRDHRQYYENVKPRVISRWENGTPLQRDKKFADNNRIKRRMTDTFIVVRKNQTTPPNNRQSIHVVRENTNEDDDDDVFDDQEEDIPVEDASMAAMASTSRKMETAKVQFQDIFTKANNYLQNKSTTDIERKFINRQLSHINANISYVDFMMSDLTDRADRITKFIENREKGLDWNFWKN